jgi:pimeloyl-ACP methyl ester carboxylesterase
MARYDARARLGALTAPTLVVSAERDLIARVSSGRALAAAIPGARFVEIRGAGHGLPIQYPDRINALLLEHFTRV